MLPFTTYNIPDSPVRETLQSVKWLWVVVESEISAPEDILLEKICLALKADLVHDVFKISLKSGESISIAAPAEMNPRLTVSFGIKPSRVGTWIDLPSPGLRLLESSVFILAHTLKELNESPAAKKQLWNSIQFFLEMK